MTATLPPLLVDWNQKRQRPKLLVTYLQLVSFPTTNQDGVGSLEVLDSQLETSSSMAFATMEATPSAAEPNPNLETNPFSRLQELVFRL